MASDPGRAEPPARCRSGAEKRAGEQRAQRRRPSRWGMASPPSQEEPPPPPPPGSPALNRNHNNNNQQQPPPPPPAEVPADVRKCGYLRKHKHGHKRFFVLRAGGEEAQEAPARLEYYESEKKWRSKAAAPKRAIALDSSCLHVHKRADAKHKHLLALYTRAEYVALAADSEAEQEAWFRALTEALQQGAAEEEPPPSGGGGGIPPAECGLKHLPRGRVGGGGPRKRPLGQERPACFHFSIKLGEE
uniref:Uncharacterized protein n=1 Tax=Sphaerodactylus townsendi TaxID=933632 RepID=A0ACB8GEF5_9SAUR